MKTYKLIEARTNGGSDMLLLIDGLVVSRWVFAVKDPALEDIGDLRDWDNQAAVGNDLSDYQEGLDDGGFEVLVIAEQPGGIATID